MNRQWNKQDDEFIKDNLKDLGIKGCSKYLGLTQPTVRKHAQRLGLINKIHYSKITDEEVDIIRKYYPQHGVKFCSKKINKSPRHVTHIARHFNINFIPPPLEDINIEEFSEFYIQNGTKLTVQKFNLSKTRVEWWIKKLNLKICKKQQSLRRGLTRSIKPFEEYKINPNKFLNPDTPEIAYILGYLWADGHISKHGNSTMIDCLEKDLRSVEWIFDKIGIWQKRVHYGKSSKNPLLTFAVHNKYIRDFLVENDYMIKSGESADKIISKIPDKNKHLFFRGFLDGDGSIMSGGRISCLCFSGPKNQNWNFIESQFKRLDISNYTIERYTRKNRNSSGSAIRLYSIANIVKFGNYIYNGYEEDKIGLERKYNKFKFIKNLNLNVTFYRNIHLRNIKTGKVIITRSVLDAAKFIGCGTTTINRKMNKSYNGWEIKHVVMPSDFDFNQNNN